MGEAPAVSWQREEWDSEVLGVPAGRMGISFHSGRDPGVVGILSDLISKALQQAAQEGIQFLSLRVPEAETTPLHAAQAAGFRVVESYLTFEFRPLASLRQKGRDSPQGPRVRAARLEEGEEVAQLAERGFRHHRYLSDPFIPEPRGRYSRRLWVLNAFQGRADAIYVAEDEGRITGFVLLKSKKDRSNGLVGGIDLLAVDESHAGLGIGKALVAQAIGHYAGQQIPVQVGTQGKNIPAVRLYTQMGFELKRTELSLHWHRGNPR